MLPNMWLFTVEFARWTSPDSTSLTVGICAETAEEAITAAKAEAVRGWQSEADNLSVRAVTRGAGIHAVVSGAASPPDDRGSDTGEGR